MGVNVFTYNSNIYFNKIYYDNEFQSTFLVFEVLPDPDEVINEMKSDLEGHIDKAEPVEIQIIQHWKDNQI